MYDLFGPEVSQLLLRTSDEHLAEQACYYHTVFECAQEQKTCMSIVSVKIFLLLLFSVFFFLFFF